MHEHISFLRNSSLSYSSVFVFVCVCDLVLSISKFYLLYPVLHLNILLY